MKKSVMFYLGACALFLLPAALFGQARATLGGRVVDSQGAVVPDAEVVVTADEFGDPSNVAMHLTVNGELRQKTTTASMVFDLPRLIEFTSAYYTLEPGDLIYTGTPAGVGPVKPGDTIEAHVERIGSMQIAVR